MSTAYKFIAELGSINAVNTKCSKIKYKINFCFYKFSIIILNFLVFMQEYHPYLY